VGERLAVRRPTAEAGSEQPKEGACVAVKQGWQGRVFEDLEPGDIFEHPLGRTITQADNIWFTLLTLTNNTIHFDSAYAAQTEFKRPLVDSTFRLALLTDFDLGVPHDLSTGTSSLG
jgi:acyl dehydratase